MKMRRANTNYILARFGLLKAFWQLRGKLLKLDFYRQKGILKVRYTKDKAAAETTALRSCPQHLSPYNYRGLGSFWFVPF